MPAPSLRLLKKEAPAVLIELRPIVYSKARRLSTQLHAYNSARPRGMCAGWFSVSRTGASGANQMR